MRRAKPAVAAVIAAAVLVRRRLVAVAGRMPGRRLRAVARKRWRAVNAFKNRRPRTRRQRLTAGGLAVLLLASLVAPILISRQGQAAWWDTSWAYRRKITINNSASAESLANFPLRVSLNSSRVDYTETQNSGQDIRFVDSNNSTVLKHEIESWNEAGTSEVWVKVPQIDANSASDYIWMYYGNAGAADGQDAVNVWDSSFGVVYHLKEDPSGTAPQLQESTANNLDMTSNGSMPAGSQIAGQINGSLDFDGSNDFLSRADAAAFTPSGDMTVSVWAKLDQLATTKGEDIVFTTKAHSASPFYSYQIYASSVNNKVFASWTDSGLTSVGINSSATLAAGTWYNIVFQRSGTAGKIFVNGADVTDGSSTLSGTMLDSNDTFRVGAFDGGQKRIDGQMDEVRISSNARSADWLEAEYLAGTDALNTFSTQESQVSTRDEWIGSGQWLFRRKITINNSASAENLVNFPLRVSLTSSNISYANTQDAGQDIRFSDPDGTLLKHEIENWNEAGTSEVWVKVPQIDAASTTDYIWMYYGNAAAADGQDAAAVWQGSYRGVWHAKHASGTSLTDSTANANTGTLTNGPTFAAGQIYNGVNFDGVNDVVNAGSGASLDNMHSQGGGGMTVSGWMKINAGALDNGTWGEIANKAQDAGPTNGWLFEVYGDTDNLAFVHTTSGTAVERRTATDSLDALVGNWAHVAVSWTGSLTATNIKMYINGAETTYATTTNGSGTITDEAVRDFTLGCDAAVADCLDGMLDEMRAANVVHSADWLEAEYLSGNNSMNSFGSQEADGYTPEGDWQYRRRITFNNAPSGALSNFPVRVSLNSSRIDYASVQNAGQDLRFYDANGTQLAHEIERWDETGSSEVWVNVPSIGANSVTDYIWMYYGNASAADGQNGESVWNSNYRGVWHLGETGNGTASEYQDSTSSNDHGRGGNGSTALTPATVPGQIGRAQGFDGNDDSINMTNTALFSGAEAYTLEAWVSVASCGEGTDGVFIAKDNVMSFNVCQTLNDNLGLYYEVNGSDAHTVVSSLAFSKWVHVAVTYNNNNTATIYLNGKPVAMADTTVTEANAAGVVIIGGDGNGGVAASSFNFHGLVDEARITNTIQTADWLNASYRSGADQFATYGAQESEGQASAGWCNDTSGVQCTTAWTARRAVTFINQPAVDHLTDFPALVVLDNDWFDYGRTQNSGQDIRFVDPANPDEALAHEIETWNESDKSYVWVKVPRVDKSSNSDYIWMYYGNGTTGDGQDTATWNSNFRGVWHMSATSGNETDATSYTSDGSVVGTLSRGVAGVVGNAYEYVATAGNYLEVADPGDNHLDFGTGSVTWSAWMKIDAITAGFQTIMQKGAVGTTAGYSTLINASGTLSARMADGVVGTELSDTTTPTYPTAWTHVMGVVDRSANVIRLYVNGVEIGDGEDISAYGSIDNNVSLTIGDRAAGQPTDGRIDEVRVMSGVQTKSWALAEYLTASDQMNTFGPQQNMGLEAPTLTALTGGQISTTPTFQLRAADAVSPGYLRYKIEVCTTSDCSSVLRTIDQTLSQTGWTGQDAQSSTAYVASATLSSSTLASHTYQSPALTAGQTYWWRGYAIDPGGDNVWSPASAASSFTVAAPPTAPVLVEPPASAASVSLLPQLRLHSTDANSDYLRYRIEVCSTSNCSAVVRTIDQTLSQTGWLTQGAAGGTAYTSAPVGGGGSQNAVHQYQAPALAASTQYWWRGYAIDPAGSNTWSAASSISTFTTGSGRPDVEVRGGTEVRGGSQLGL